MIYRLNSGLAVSTLVGSGLLLLALVPQSVYSQEVICYEGSAWQIRKNGYTLSAAGNLQADQNWYSSSGVPWYGSISKSEAIASSLDSYASDVQDYFNRVAFVYRVDAATQPKYTPGNTASFSYFYKGDYGGPNKTTSSTFSAAYANPKLWTAASATPYDNEFCQELPTGGNIPELLSELPAHTRTGLLQRSGGNFTALVAALTLPRNVTAAGGLATQAYVNDLADTIFDRLPTRKFTPAGIEGENGDVDLSTITLDETVYSESNNLTSIYTDSNGTRVWTRGFAGSKQPYSTGGASGKNGLYYPDVYNDFYSNHGGFVIGVDTSVTENIQLGVFGNYGNINLQHFAGQYSGNGSWTPTGFGGGITASYVDESFYVQGLFGATGFSGDNKRQVRVAGVLDETYTANKNTTSYVGALRVGAPLTWGDTILEPQATAIWNGNNDSSYTESGRYESLALKVDSYSDSFLETTIGAKLAWPIKQSNGNLLVPNVRVAWLADWDTGNGAVKFKRKNSRADITAEIPSNQEMQNGVLLEGGVDYAIVQGPTSAWKLYAKGGAKVWANANTDWRASGGVTFSFGGAPQGSTTIEVVEELSVEPAPEPAPAAPAFKLASYLSK